LFLSSLAFAQIDLSIRYYDKRIYYIQGDENNPIYVQITLTNNTPVVYRFKLADERAFSVDFEVRTVSNWMVPQSASLTRKRNENQHIYYREVSIAPGEAFSFIEDIRHYADLQYTGSFVIWARMYPELYFGQNHAKTDASHPLESNRLSLSIRPQVIMNSNGIPLEMDVETNAVLVRDRLPPDNVLRYVLTARQKSQWEKFFLYLDLEAMITRDGVWRRQWLTESEEGRRRMIARYRGELQSSAVDGDIATIPVEFEIERTTYNESEGTVIVLEKFKTGNLIERKRYTYYLRQRDGIWMIVDYSVMNLGVE
jgi:hypothetical protein